jgi:hypothetical protein
MHIIIYDEEQEIETIQIFQANASILRNILHDIIAIIIIVIIRTTGYIVKTLVVDTCE